MIDSVMKLFDGKLHIKDSTALFDAWRPVEVESVEGEPPATFKGVNMPYSIWEMARDWMLSNNKGEVQLKLYYHPKNGVWQITPLPQYYPTGLSSQEIECVEADKIKGNMISRGYELMGTIHSHCNIGAFQSGTDHQDEIRICGIHITVGDLNKSVLSLHARVCVILPGVFESDEKGFLVNKAHAGFYKCRLSDWFELPPEVSGLDDELKEIALEHYMTQNKHSGQASPRGWDAMLQTPSRMEYPETSHSQGATGKARFPFRSEREEFEWMAQYETAESIAYNKRRENEDPDAP